jgi:hypothetical protein
MKALVVAAAFVFLTLALGTAWLAFFPGEGESVAILQIEPAPQPAEVSSSESEATPESAAVPASLPPGFAVLGPLPTAVE